MDFTKFVSFLKHENELDEESATELALSMTGVIVETFSKAKSVMPALGLDPSESPQVLTSQHIKFALQPFAKSLGPPSIKPTFIRADGDGNCLLTTLALALEMKVRKRKPLGHLMH